MGIHSFYASVLSPFIRSLPLGERLDMALVAFNANFQFAVSIYAASGSRIFSDREVGEIFDGMDEESIRLARRFMHRQFCAPPNSLMVHPKYFYDPDEKAEYRRMKPHFEKAVRKYHLPRHKVGPESLYYHHGLRFAPDPVKRRIAGTVFADVGVWLGDSAMVFQQYDPSLTVIFEPGENNRKLLVRNLARCGIRPEKYLLRPFALSDADGIAEGMECRCLDDVAADCPGRFGVLKADVEGMGLRFVQGAKETILRDRPLLSLAIYHNADEFCGIYRTMKGWDIDYHFEIKQFSPFMSHGELSLLAYPAEWLK